MTRDYDDARNRSYDDLEVPGATRAFLRSILPRTRKGMLVALGGFALGEVIALAGFLAGSSFWLYLPPLFTGVATAIALPRFRRGEVESWEPVVSIAPHVPRGLRVLPPPRMSIERALYEAHRLAFILLVCGLSLIPPTALAAYDYSLTPVVRAEPVRRATQYVRRRSGRSGGRVRTSPAPGYTRQDGVFVLDSAGRRLEFLSSYALWSAIGVEERVSATVERTPHVGELWAIAYEGAREENDARGLHWRLVTLGFIFFGGAIATGVAPTGIDWRRRRRALAPPPAPGSDFEWGG